MSKMSTSQILLEDLDPEKRYHKWMNSSCCKDNTLSNSRDEDKAFEKCIISSVVLCMHHPFLLSKTKNASAKY